MQMSSCGGSDSIEASVAFDWVSISALTFIDTNVLQSKLWYWMIVSGYELEEMLSKLHTDMEDM